VATWHPHPVSLRTHQVKPIHTSEDGTILSVIGGDNPIGHRFYPLRFKSTKEIYAELSKKSHMSWPFETKWSELSPIPFEWKALRAETRLSYIPLKARDVLLRTYTRAIQVRSRFANFKDAALLCPRCQEKEDILHCFFFCPTLDALYKDLLCFLTKFYNISEPTHWDILFNTQIPLDLALPWQILKSIYIYHCWTHRCTYLERDNRSVPQLALDIMSDMEQQLQSLFFLNSKSTKEGTCPPLKNLTQLLTRTVPLLKRANHQQLPILNADSFSCFKHLKCPSTSMSRSTTTPIVREVLTQEGGY
jgi:hypothetical protein